MKAQLMGDSHQTAGSPAAGETEKHLPNVALQKPRRTPRHLDTSKYTSRLIALKFAYLGQGYNGLEYHSGNKTALPTVEEVLWRALYKARLIFPTPNSLLEESEVNWKGCDYSKCGRTDKGVSAFGQVIGIRVRSNRPRANHQRDTSKGPSIGDNSTVTGPSNNIEITSPLIGNCKGFPCVTRSPPPLHKSSNDQSASFDYTKDELPYCQILNRLLPSDIRILAWCPAPPADFSARFSCKERQYRYFFTQPAFTPTFGGAGLSDNESQGPEYTPSSRRDGWLDIEAMQKGAKKFEGLHDFRNFHKLDPSRQVNNFERRMFFADVQEVDPKSLPASYIGWPGYCESGNASTATDELTGINSFYGQRSSITTPKVYAFIVHGSGFLWHQIRCMVAILFLIGQGLESPDLVDKLLDVKITYRKPNYTMADDAPLVLWDCIFPHADDESRRDALEWINVGNDADQMASKTPNKGNGKHGFGGVVDEMWGLWRQKKMKEILVGSLLNLVAGQGCSSTTGETPLRYEKQTITSVSQKVFRGGNNYELKGRYTPILQLPVQDTAEIQNARYAKRKRIIPREDIPQQVTEKL